MVEAAEHAVPAENRSLWGSVKPYLEKESLAAFALGISSGFPFAMIAATLHDNTGIASTSSTSASSKATNARISVARGSHGSFPSSQASQRGRG